MIVYCCSIFASKSNHPRSYDVISISQDGGHGVANIIPVSCLLCTR